jgi:antitoxin component of MazEF toxin-antitoxin module
VKARIVRIGKGRGIRIPEAFLEQTGLNDEVELAVEGSTLVIKPAAAPEAPPTKKGTRKGKVPALPPYAKLRELAKKFPPPAIWFEEDGKPHAEWEAAFKEMRTQGEDNLLDGGAPLTTWDEEEWEW